MSSKKAEDIKSLVDSLDKDLSAKSDRVASLEKDLSAKSDRVASLEKDLSAKGDRVASLEKDLSAKSARVASLEKDLSAKSDRVASLEKDLSAKSDRVASLEKDLSAKNDHVLSWRVVKPRSEELQAAAQSPAADVAASASTAAAAPSSMEEPSKSLGPPELSFIMPPRKFFAELGKSELVLKGKGTAEGLVVPYKSIQCMWELQDVDASSFFACLFHKEAPVTCGKTQLLGLVTKPVKGDVVLTRPDKSLAKGDAARVLHQCLKDLAAPSVIPSPEGSLDVRPVKCVSGALASGYRPSCLTKRAVPRLLDCAVPRPGHR